MLAATVGALACGGYSYVFFLSVRRALSTIRNFIKFLSKIKQITTLVIAKVRSTCGDPRGSAHLSCIF